MSDGFDQLVEGLSSQLKGLELSKSRKGGTRLISRVIETIANEYGWDCEREVFVGERKDGRRGYCDFALSKQQDEDKIIVEIDSSNKKWSLTKLIEAQRLGNKVIWVRWNCPVKFEIPAFIHLIDLSS